MITHKYNAVRTECDNFKFASKAEKAYYEKLKLLKQTGDISFFLMQVPIHLKSGIKYVCDFVVFWTNGEVTFEDVKGMKTSVYKLKRKIVEQEYPFAIKEITKI